MNRITAASYPGALSEAFSYDAAGNRTSRTDVDGATVGYTVDATGQLISDTTGTTYSYDAAGNLTGTSAGEAYVYDEYGRATSITAGGVTETYGYDVQDVRATVNGVTQLWDRNGLPTLTSTGAGDNYVHIDGVARDGNDWLLAYAVGSVRATVDQTSVVSAETAFTAYGEPLTGTTDTFGFAGEQHDPTGLQHLRARQYNPGLGRFTTVDPVQPGAPGTTGYNLYTYAANNPTTFTDPSGQAVAIQHVGLGVAAVVALGYLATRSREAPAFTDDQVEDLWDNFTANLEDVAISAQNIMRRDQQGPQKERNRDRTKDPLIDLPSNPDHCESVGPNADGGYIDGTSPPYDLFSLGRSGIQPHPRIPGRDGDVDPDDGSLCAFPRRDGELAGLSSFAELSDFNIVGLTGQVWRLPANSPLGPLAVIADGENYGGPRFGSHHTIFTTTSLQAFEIDAAYTSLPWERVGHTRDL